MLNRTLIINKAMIVIKDFEGFRSYSYYDDAGVLTIGYGFTHNVIDARPFFEKGSITKEQATNILYKEIEARVNKLLDIVLKDILDKLELKQIVALTSFVYNFSIERLKKSQLLKLIKQDPFNYEVIENEYMKWIHIDKKENKGLINRRKKEFLIYKKGL